MIDLHEGRIDGWTPSAQRSERDGGEVDVVVSVETEGSGDRRSGVAGWKVSVSRRPVLQLEVLGTPNMLEWVHTT